MIFHDHDMNEMDSLYRKAAENYPLKIREGDWNDVSAKLIATTVKTLPAKKKRRNRNLRLLLLLLIMLVLFIYPGFLVKNNGKPISGSTKSPADEKSVSVVRSAEPVKKKQSLGPIHQRVQDKPHHVEIRASAQKITADSKNSPGMLAILSVIEGGLNDHAQPVNPTRIRFTHDISVADRLSATRFPIDKTSALMSSDPGAVATNKKRPPLRSRNKGLYVGLTLGPDFSNIKAQPVDRAGYTLGLLTGYRLSRRISVESGVLWSRKKYYTDGKYFSMSKVGPSMPSAMKIVTVDGQFTLFEIPLKGKYDFLIRRNSNLFVSTGILSNIYLRERNSYLTEMNGVQEYHLGLYEDEFYSWLSSLNISAGYEHLVGRNTVLRLEPYIKIPLKKAGMGSMPVQSIGINIAVSNLFSK